MNKFLRVSATLLCWLGIAFGVDWKALKPEGYVSDFAHVIDGRSKAQLERYCATVERSTGVMFLSGAVKLLSGDATWRNLTAFEYHYQTPPLPTPFAWYFHQFPPGFQKASVVFVFLVELVAPFFMFAPRRVRFFCRRHDRDAANPYLHHRQLRLFQSADRRALPVFI